MSPLPTKLRDRWANRAEPTADRGNVYWHMLMSSHDEVRAAAKEVQDALSKFSGLHFTPIEWLHMTTLVAGSTEDLSREQLTAMLDEARQRLIDIKPIPVTINRILYHPEAIMLLAEPKDALLPVFTAARDATFAATGNQGRVNGESAIWTPHITISYSTAEQSANPIISALGKSIAARRVVVDSLSLVVQWGPERNWNWEPVETVPLGSR